MSKYKPFDKIEMIRKATSFNSTQKLILFIIASHLGKYDFCYLSLNTLHQETGLALSTVKENLVLLIEFNVIFKISPDEKYKSNRYGINYDLVGRVAAEGWPPGGSPPAARKTRGGRQAATKRNLNKIKENEREPFAKIEAEKARAKIRKTIGKEKKSEYE